MRIRHLGEIGEQFSLLDRQAIARRSPLVRAAAFFRTMRAIEVLRDEGGQTLVSSAVIFSVLLGFVGLATDVGLLWREKRMMQTAADGAAVNGAAEIPVGDWKAGAKAGAALNGATDGLDGATVTVNKPPLSGAYAGNTNYVEVIASQSEKPAFMGVFGFPSMTVSARAVAYNTPSKDCIVTLGSDQTSQTSPPGATGAGINISGSGSLNVPGCGITDDADKLGNSAIALSGSASITAGSVSTAGTVASGDESKITTTYPTTVTTGISPVSDPLAGIVSPPTKPGTLCTQLSYSSGAIPSTCYYSSLTISGTVTVSGVYYIQGNLTIQGGANVTGSGVTFYVTCPSGDCTSTSTENCSYACITVSASTLNISPPGSGSTQNVVFYQDPSDPETASMQGGSSGTLAGIIYLPSAGLTLGGGSGSTFNIDLLTQWLNVTGPSTITPFAPLDIPSSIPDPVLAE